jgi:imidazolonepropionase-like amidohydrolase
VIVVRDGRIVAVGADIDIPPDLPVIDLPDATLMPGLVKNHDHAARLNESPFMDAIEATMAEDDVMVLVHGYLGPGSSWRLSGITHVLNRAGWEDGQRRPRSCCWQSMASENSTLAIQPIG